MAGCALEAEWSGAPAGPVADLRSAHLCLHFQLVLDKRPSVPSNDVSLSRPGPEICPLRLRTP